VWDIGEDNTPENVVEYTDVLEECRDVFAWNMAEMTTINDEQFRILVTDSASVLRITNLILGSGLIGRAPVIRRGTYPGHGIDQAASSLKNVCRGIICQFNSKLYLSLGRA
jgi:hypothetical protein